MSGRSDSPPAKRTRRMLLSAAAAGAGAAALSRATHPGPTLAGTGSVVIDADNVGSGRTALNSSSVNAPGCHRSAFMVVNSGSEGENLYTRVAVHGILNPASTFIFLGYPAAVAGQTYLDDDLATGVAGSAEGTEGIGVRGYGGRIGVLAGVPPGKEGALAIDARGPSLLRGAVDVEGALTALQLGGPGGGPPKFSTAGRARIPKGQDRKRVSNAFVTPRSAVLVTLLADPGGPSLLYVKPATGSFEVVLTGEASASVPFAYLVLA